jgi:hypothetical protein
MIFEDFPVFILDPLGILQGLFLVGGWAYPSEKWWSSSVGMIIPFPTEWKVIKFHGSSHHQPDISLTTINHY